MKKSICILMAALLVVVSAMSSCGGSATAETTSEAGSNSQQDTSAADKSPKLNLPETNYNGKEFTILSTAHAEYEYAVDEITGDVVSDAVYNRNKAIEEQLGITLNINTQPGHWSDRNSFNALIKNSVMAGDGEFDLVNGVTVCVLPTASEGLFIDANELQYVNFNNPWWVQGMTDNLTINGKLFGFIGDASLSLYKDLAVFFFNKKLLNDYQLENPYELVRSGKWTIDKLNTMIQGVSKDVDGDGSLTWGVDMVGIISQAVPNRAFITSSQLDIVNYVDGTPQMSNVSERTINIYNQLYKLFKENENVLLNPQDEYEQSAKLFAQDLGLFMNTLLNVTDYLRDMKSDFGIIPYPKADEKQENYHTQIGTSTSMFFVPNTTNDVDLTSMFCEAASYYSYLDVTPAYYEVALKEKYTRDEDVKEMLNIIRDGAQMDFTFAYSTMFEPFINSFTEFRSSSTIGTDLASYYATNLPKWQTKLADILEAYQ